MKKKKPGRPKGTMPENFKQFQEAAKQTQFAPGYSGQSKKQVEGTKHLKDWLDQYDNPPPTVFNPGAEPLPLPESISPEKKKHIEQIRTREKQKTHAERVQEMLEKLRPGPSRMIDNDPVSLVKNYKG